MDWRGFARFDIPLAVGLLMFDIDQVSTLEAALFQGFANKIAIKQIIPLILEAERNALSIPVAASIPDLSQSSFVGVSMGGILGGGYVAAANYSRAVLLVAGSPFTYVLGRSDLISFYLYIMNMQFFNRIDSRVALTSLQIKVS